MLRIGNRATSGDGTAIVDAGASQRVRVQGYVFLQAQEAGPVTALLKFVDGETSTSLHAGIKLVDDGSGVVLDLPAQTSTPGAALHLNLSDAKSVNYTIWAELVEW